MEMKPVAVILNDKELVRLLTHLGLLNSRSLSRRLRRHYMNTPAARRTITASWTHGLITKL